MQTYRLPQELGGAQIEATETWGGCAGGQPEYSVAGSQIRILMPPGTPMERVEPPLPTEPEPGAYLIGDRICIWFKPTNAEASWRWFDHWGDGCYGSWFDAWEDIGGPDVSIVPLVPKPAEEAP